MLSLRASAGGRGGPTVGSDLCLQVLVIAGYALSNSSSICHSMVHRWVPLVPGFNQPDLADHLDANERQGGQWRPHALVRRLMLGDGGHLRSMRLLPFAAAA